MPCSMNSWTKDQTTYCQDLLSGTAYPTPAKRSGTPTNAMAPHKSAPANKMCPVPASGRVKPSSVGDHFPAIAKPTTHETAEMLKTALRFPRGVHTAPRINTKTTAISAHARRASIPRVASGRLRGCKLLDSMAEITSDFGGMAESNQCSDATRKQSGSPRPEEL